jgi:methylmalonyl-CoA carboxyltransferase small subunit
MKLKIAIEGKTYEVEVEILEGGEGFLLPSGTGGARTSYTPAVKRSASAATAAPAAARPSAPSATSKGACVSPLAGNIWKVLVEVGQKVAADETLVIIEAMKMETVIAAPMAGTVKAVFVKPGDAVKVNHVLVELE